MPRSFASAIPLAALVAFALSGTSAFPQDEAPAWMTFHVSSVAYGDSPEGYCGSGYCSATKITVKGSVNERGKAVHYILSCVEVVPTPGSPPSTAFTNCPHLHANKDYQASVYGLDAMDFAIHGKEQPEQVATKRPIMYALFKIDSESD